MAKVPSPAAAADACDPLDIVTICKADSWVEDVLPRFATMIDAHCSGTVRRHLLLLTEPEVGAGEARVFGGLVDSGWHSVVCRPFVDPHPHRRLLFFDTLRAGLLSEFGLREALYMDPDTDVVADLQGIQRIAPEADLLWAANPLPLTPVIDDLRRFVPELAPPSGPTPARAGVPGPVLMEPGFFLMRRDLSAELLEVCRRFPDANVFAPGSTYWNILMRNLGGKAVRLPDDFNTTFWDISAAASTAKSVHFTGQWKRLQPHLEYDRPARRITIHATPSAPLRRVPASRPTSVAVIALYRDNAGYLPHAFARFEAWERSGISVRYYFLENDSEDQTAALLAGFMRGRAGSLQRRQLANPVPRSVGAESYDRIMTLARMRSYIVDRAMADPPQSADEWTLLVDSEIFFPDDVLDRMFAARARDPQPDSIGMLTCYTQQLFDPRRMPGTGTPVEGHPGMVAAGHYFDTYAFHDLAHRHYHPACAFAACRRCRSRDALPLIPHDRGIVDVSAAFGGLAAVPTWILRDPRIRWTTYGNGLEQSRMLSEHVVFCDRLHAITGRRIVVLQDVDCVYRR